MPVFVDDMYLYRMGRFGRLKCSHMIASTDQELHAMASRIGISDAHWQSPEKTSGSHYDISMSKRALALNAGAIPITMRQLTAMNARRRETGELGDPETAIEWLLSDRKARRALLAAAAPGDFVLGDNTKNIAAVVTPETISKDLRLSQATLFPLDEENPAS